MVKSAPGKRKHSIDALRFILAVLIINFHIFHSYIQPYAKGIAFYSTMYDRTSNSLVVECFFIISGFYLFRTTHREKLVPVGRFIVERLVRLWPVFAFQTVICVLFFGLEAGPALFDLLFLRDTGISLEWKGLLWYVGPFFWATIFYYAFITCNKASRKADIVVALLVFFGYCILVQANDGGFSRMIIMKFLSLGLLRALAGIGSGYLLGLIYQNLTASNLYKYALEKTPSMLQQLFFSVLELGAAAYLAKYFLVGGVYHNRVIVVIAFSLLWMCMQTDKGIVSIVLEHFPLLWRGGKYGYCMYIMQLVCFRIMQKTLWQHRGLVERPALCLPVSILFCILVAIAAYWLIEHPVVQVYNKLRAKADEEAVKKEEAMVEAKGEI